MPIHYRAIKMNSTRLNQVMKGLWKVAVLKEIYTTPPTMEKNETANAMSHGLIPHSIQALKVILEKFF